MTQASRLAWGGLLILLSGCRSFRNESFQLAEKYCLGAPPLEVVIETKGFEHGGWSRLVRDCYTREINENLLPGRAAGEPVGTLKVVAAMKSHSTGWFWVIPSILTLTAINLTGFPFGSHSAAIDLEVTVASRDGATVGSFKSSSGSRSAFAAYFWGYSAVGVLSSSYLGDTVQAAMCEAAVAAMDDVGKKMRAAGPALWSRLR